MKKIICLLIALLMITSYAPMFGVEAYARPHFPPYQPPTPTYYTVSTEVHPDNGGTVKVNGENSIEVAEDEEVEITPTPASGYKVNSVQYSYSSKGSKVTEYVHKNEDGKYIFEMPKHDVTVTVIFERDYTVTTVVVCGCEADHAGMVTSTKENGFVTVNLNLDENHELDSLKYSYEYYWYGQKTFSDDVHKYNGTYIFRMPDADVTVTATLSYEQPTVPTYTVTVDDSVKDYVSVDKTEAEEGETVTVTATPEEGYVVDEIVVEKTNNDEAELVAVAEEDKITVTKNDDGTYSFTMPAYAVTVKATFAPITYKVTYYDIDGNKLEEFTVEHGSDVPENDIPALPYNEEYPEEAYNQNSAWDHDGQDIVEDTDIRPNFFINEYEVKFFVEGKQYGRTQMVKHGEDAVVPEFPYTEEHPEEAYDQESGWNDDGKNITAPRDIKADYVINEYTVKFTFMGFVVKEQTVEHGSDAEPPMLMTNHRWDKSFRNITEDTVIRAIVGRPADKTPAAPERTEEEANPNTGAPINGVSVLGAVVLLAGATCFIGKK